MKWFTNITKVEPNHLVTKGYRQEDLIGNISFSNVVYLLLRGELPTYEHGVMMDAILTSCIDEIDLYLNSYVWENSFRKY